MHLSVYVQPMNPRIGLSDQIPQLETNRSTRKTAGRISNFSLGSIPTNEGLIRSLKGIRFSAELSSHLGKEENTQARNSDRRTKPWSGQMVGDLCAV